MSNNQSRLDQAIGHGANMEAAGNDGWPCGTMFWVGLLCFLAFVVIPMCGR